jgi:DMSO/TMAO reductase YedYZ heme-binding membrane subunit
VNVNLKPSDWVIAASGVVALIFSFFDWFDGVNGWDTNLTFPLGTYIAIFGVVMAAHVLLTGLAGTNFPDRVVGFSWVQIHLVLGLFAGLLALGWLIISPFGADKKIGLWLSVLAGLGLLAGAILKWVEASKEAQPGQASPPPSQF